MPLAVEAVSAPTLKVEEQKSSKIENFNCEFKENADIGKDLIKEISEKPVDHDKSEIKVQEDSEACLKSDEHVEKDKYVSSVKDASMKGDENLSNCKQQEVPASIDTATVRESKGPEVKILSLSVLSPGRQDVVLPIPFPATTSKSTLFTLKEGSKYRIKFHFTVSNDTVNDLKYTYMVWKAGVRVHQTKKMMGTFSPRQEPYTFELEEGTTPTGFFARGPFLVRSKFVDDENCYLDTTYYFDIRKDWGARDKC